MKKTRLVIHSLSTWEHPKLRVWQPADPTTFAETITAAIGHRTRAGSDDFSLKVATPKGLATMPARAGIIATRPLLVMERYDYDELWQWCEETLARCDGADWKECVEKLRLYFTWEYENYTEQ